MDVNAVVEVGFATKGELRLSSNGTWREWVLDVWYDIEPVWVEVGVRLFGFKLVLQVDW